MINVDHNRHHWLQDDLPQLQLFHYISFLKATLKSETIHQIEIYSMLLGTLVQFYGQLLWMKQFQKNNWAISRLFSTRWYINIFNGWPVETTKVFKTSRNLCQFLHVWKSKDTGLKTFVNVLIEKWVSSQICFLCEPQLLHIRWNFCSFMCLFHGEYCNAVPRLTNWVHCEVRLVHSCFLRVSWFFEVLLFSIKIPAGGNCAHQIRSRMGWGGMRTSDLAFIGWYSATVTSAK